MNDAARMPGGYRLVPEPKYLAGAETPEELLRRHAEAETLLPRVREMHLKLREAYQDLRRLDLRIHRARQLVKGDRVSPFETEEEREAKETEERLCAEHDELRKKVDDLEWDFESLTRHIRRNFFAASVERDALDLRLPNKHKVQKEVGEPVGGF